MAFSLKKYVNDQEFVLAFSDYLAEKIHTLQTTLLTANELHVIYRLQGQIITYKRLLNIRDDVNSTDKT